MGRAVMSPPGPDWGPLSPHGPGSSGTPLMSRDLARVENNHAPHLLFPAPIEHGCAIACARWMLSGCPLPFCAITHQYPPPLLVQSGIKVPRLPLQLKVTKNLKIRNKTTSCFVEFVVQCLREDIENQPFSLYVSMQYHRFHICWHYSFEKGACGRYKTRRWPVLLFISWYWHRERRLRKL